MPTYVINNTRGNNVANIAVGTTTGTNFPIELVGQGVSLYGPIIATNQYKLLENFANTTAPSSPVEGMIWHKLNSVPRFYNGTSFIPFATGENSASVGVDMLATASNVDFTTAGTVSLFTNPADGSSFHPTGVALFPTSVVDVTTNPVFNIFIGTSEDVMENQSIINPDVGRSLFFSIEGSTAFATGSDTISLDVSIAASGGGSLSLIYDVQLYGIIRS